MFEKFTIPKSASFISQLELINNLSESNEKIGEAIRRKFNADAQGKLFQTQVIGDTKKIIKALIISRLAADIENIPDQELRKPFWGRVQQLCEYYSISWEDIAFLLRHASEFEEIENQNSD